MSVITLTTDFGLQDWFVGTLKGVILGINSRARVVDIAHQIPPGDVRAGAFALGAAARHFPKGTIHVAVVDPGVGSQRRAIAVRTKRFFFVGPDNGVLSRALAEEEVRSVRLIENSKLFLNAVSQTFHGRDVFVPVAAHLSKGLGFRKVGPRAGSYVQLDWPKPEVDENGVTGQVIYIDHFGNAITNIAAELLPKDRRLNVHLRAKKICEVESFYNAAPAGAPVAVIGSSGLLELAVNGGSAASKYRLNVGEPLEIKWGN